MSGLGFSVFKRLSLWDTLELERNRSAKPRRPKPWSGGQRFKKCFFTATTMLLVMFGEPLVANGADIGSILRASGRFQTEAVPLGYNTPAAQKIEVQMVSEKNYLIAYFLDQVPDDISASTMPITARDIVVARVRLAQRPTYYLVLRGTSEDEDAPPPKSLYRAHLKVLEVFSGRATLGDGFEVAFGVPSGEVTLHPTTPRQVGRDYVVVIYTDDEGQRRLAGFPIEEAQYRAWEAEVGGSYGRWGEPKEPK